MIPILELMANSRRHAAGVNNLAYVKETAIQEAVAANVLTFTPADTPGNLLVVGVASHGASSLAVTNFGSPGSNVDPGGNTWAKAVSVTNSPFDAEIWYTVTSAICGLVTITFAGSVGACGSCQEWSGSSATPLDVTKTGTAASGTVAATGNSASTGSVKEVAIGFVFFGGTRTFSAQTSGYTPLTTLSSPVSGLLISGQSAYQKLSAAGVQAYGATSNGSAQWLALLATFKSS